MKGFKKTNNTIERYEATIQHKVHLFIEESETELTAYISLDNYGYTTHLIGVPKQYHNTVTDEDVVNTKEQFIDDVINYYIDDDAVYYYFKDIEKLEADE